MNNPVDFMKLVGFIIQAASFIWMAIGMIWGVIAWLIKLPGKSPETGRPCPCCKSRHEHACCCGCFPKCARTCNECGACPEHCGCGQPAGTEFDSKIEVEGAA